MGFKGKKNIRANFQAVEKETSRHDQKAVHENQPEKQGDRFSGQYGKPDKRFPEFPLFYGLFFYRKLNMNAFAASPVCGSHNEPAFLRHDEPFFMAGRGIPLFRPVSPPASFLDRLFHNFSFVGLSARKHSWIKAGETIAEASRRQRKGAAAHDALYHPLAKPSGQALGQDPEKSVQLFPGVPAHWRGGRIRRKASSFSQVYQRIGAGAGSGEKRPAFPRCTSASGLVRNRLLGKGSRELLSRGEAGFNLTALQAPFPHHEKVISREEGLDMREDEENQEDG